MSAELTRKKKLRGAHRASVTRMIAVSYEVIGSEEHEESVARKLNQKKGAIVEKRELLKVLDAELLDLINEDELEEEITVSDEIQEKIDLVLLDIDRALNRIAKEKSKSPTPDRASTVRSGSKSPSPLTVADHSSDDVVTSPRATEREDDVGSSDPRRPTLVVPTLRSSDPVEDDIVATHVPRVKLPKLSLKKFNGDLTQWVTFWDTFESSIHSNPSLTRIDKFNYLSSLLESTAAEAISGLTAAEAISGLKLTAANYEEAITSLKRRFGNRQLIVNRHMEILMNLDTVSSHHNLRAVRHLFDVVEANIRGLRGLGVPSESYGGLLSSILMTKLPPELRLCISRELTEDRWELDRMMKIFERELDARERSAGVMTSMNPRRSFQRVLPTATALVTESLGTCVYCRQPHLSLHCETVVSPEQRKQILRRSGRCFVCLRRNHTCKNCRSTMNCASCKGRHHTSICQNGRRGNMSSPPVSSQTSDDSRTTKEVKPTVTSSMCVNSRTPVLLQTAKTVVCDVRRPQKTQGARVILDSGSQRSYVTSSLQQLLSLEKVGSERMVIKTFGSEVEDVRSYDVVRLGVLTREGNCMEITAVVVPHICDPIPAQPIDLTKQHFSHLADLELADSSEIDSNLQTDILIGSDHYWDVVTGRVRRGAAGPMAIETLFGWVLSGPVEGMDQEGSVVNLVVSNTSHCMRVDVLVKCEDESPCEYDENLDCKLQRFWDVESLGTLANDDSVHERFIQQVTFKDGRYEVCLPWKDGHIDLPENRTLCQRRLAGLLRRLKQTPEYLKEYDSIIQEQIRMGIVERVHDTSVSEGQRVHYSPHHAVIRKDKQTTKLRIVYDASAKVDGPSLNECLFTGPKFQQNILDILLRFRVHKTALVGDIEKAFLMISVAPVDRDALRFMWVQDVEAEQPEIVILRFA